MKQIIFVSKSPYVFEFFTKPLSELEVFRLGWVATGEEALTLSAEGRVDIAVVDKELGDGVGLHFIKRFALQAPHIPCALVSGLAPKEFHQQTEGLGLFMQLPEEPGEVDVKRMLKILHEIGVVKTEAQEV